jgi:O-antigen/teichoic acid export membrane protein
MSLTTKALALSLAQGLQSIVTVLSAMVMSRILSQGELATYRQTFLIYELIGVLLGFGVQDAIFYFLPTESKRARGLVLDGIIIQFAMGLIFLAILAVGGGRAIAYQFSNPELERHLAYLAVLPVISLPAALVSAVLVTQNRINWLAAFTVVSNSIILGSTIVCCLLTQDTEILVLTRVVTTSLSCAVALHLTWNSLPIDDWRPNLASIKTLMLFGLPLGAASFFGALQANLDRILVSALCAPAEFAIYTNGAIEIPFIGIFTGAIAKVIAPELRKSIAHGKNNQALELFRKSAVKSAVVLIPATIFLMVVAESVMIFLYSEKYIDSVTPFRIYLLLLPARIVIYGSIMVALGLNRIILFRTACAAICNLILGFILIKWLGQAGAALASVAATYLFAILWSIVAIKKAIPCPFFHVLPYRAIGEIALISLASALPVLVFLYTASPRHEWIELLFSGLIFGACYISLAWWLKYQPIIEAMELSRRLIAGVIATR